MKNKIMCINILSASSMGEFLTILYFLKRDASSVNEFGVLQKKK